MEAEIVAMGHEVAAREIAFSQRALDGMSLAPQPIDVSATVRSGVDIVIVLVGSDAAEFSQDIFALTAGKTCYEDAAISLA
jgi:hypothetical protein